MSGIKETAIYKLELDTSSVVKNFESAIAAMKKAGVNGKITESLTNELDKLKRKSEELQSIGRFGVEGSKGIQSFDAKIKKLYESYNILGDKIKNTSKNAKNFSSPGVEKLQTEIDELQKKLVTSFDGIQKKLKEIGISADITNELGKTIKSQEELNKKLDEEKKKREANLAVAQQEADKAKANAASAVVAKGKNNLTDSNFTGGSKGDRAAAASLINEEINKLVLQGKDFDTIWSSIQEKVKGLGPVFDGDVQVQEKIRQKLLEVEKEYQKTAEAKRLAAAQSSVDAMGGVGGSVNIDGVTGDAGKAAFQGAATAAEQLKIKEAELKKTQEELARAQAQLRQHTDNLNNSVRESSAKWSTNAQAMNDSAQASEKLKGEINAVIGQVTRMFSLTAIFNSIRNAIRQTITDLTNLDKSFASIAMVTDKTLGGMWASYGDYNKMAQELGQTTDSVIKASALFYQQGLDEAEALSLTADTMKLATLAETDYETATKEMTAAIRGFKMEMDEGMHVTDVYSNLAANAAASVDEISQAMQRTASIANSAGMSFENTSAFLTQMIETTQESAENIGTSMKTIIARFTELKENVAGTEDSEFDDLDYNKVDKALKSVGVSLKDTQGQFRNLDEVFLELSSKWDTLDRNTQRYVATIAAGSRQQSRFIAMMDNYERTAELMDIAADSEGKADEQFAKYADTVEYKTNQMEAKWEEFRTSLINSDMFKGVLDGINSLMDRLNNLDFSGFSGKIKLAMIPIAIIAAKTFITNFSNSMKGLGNSFTNIGKTITNSLTKSINKKIKGKTIKIPTEADIKKSEEQILDLTNKYKGYDIKFNVSADNSATHNVKNALDSLKQSSNGVKHSLNDLAAELGVTFEDTDSTAAKIEKLNQALTGEDGLSENLNKAGTELGELKAQQQSVAITSQVFSTALSAGITAIAAFASGAISGSEAFKMFAIQLGLGVAPLLLQIALTEGLNVLKTKQAATAAAAAVAEGSLAGAELEEAIAASAAASATAAAAAATWSLLWPILLIVAAITAAVAVMALLVNHLSNVAQEQREAADASVQLEKAQDRLHKSQEKLNELKSQHDETEKEKENLEDIIENYKKLQNKVVRTTEEEEEFQSLIEQLKESYPDLISYENDLTGEIILASDATQKRLDALQEEIDKTKELVDVQQGITSLDKASVDHYQNVSNLQDALGYKINSRALDTQEYESSIGWGDYALSLATLGITSVTYTLPKELENLSQRTDIKMGIILEDLQDGVRDTTEQFDKVNDKKLIDSFGEKLGASADQTDLVTDALNGIYDSEQVFKSTLETLPNEWRDTVIEARKQVMDLANEDKKNAYDTYLETVKNNYSDDSELIQETRALNLSNQKNAYNGASYDEALSNASYRNKVGFTVKGYGWSTGRNAKIFEEALDNMGFNGSDYKDIYEDIFEAMNSGEEYSEVLSQLEVKTQEVFKQIYDEEKYKSNNDNEAIAADLGRKMAGYVLSEETGVDSGTLTDEQINYVTELEKNIGTVSFENYDETIQEVKEKFGEDSEESNKIIDYLGLNNIEETKKAVKELTGFIDSEFESLSQENVNEIQSIYDSLVDQGWAEEKAKMFMNNIFDKDAFDLTQKELMSSIDWSTIGNITEFNTFKEQQIKSWKEMGYEDAEAMFEQAQAAADNFGEIKLAINTDEELEEFNKQLDELQDNINDIGDTIVDVVGNTIEEGKVSFSTFETLKDQLEKIGESVYDYVTIDQDGNITASEEQLDALYQAQLEKQKQQLKMQLDANKAEEAKLNVTIENLKIARDSLDTGINNLSLIGDETQNTWAFAEAAHAVAVQFASISGQAPPELKGATVSLVINNKDELKKYQELLDSQIEAYSNQLTSLSEYTQTLQENYDNYDLYQLAALNDHNNKLEEERNKTDKVTDAKNKEKDATDKLKEAQEKLNSAIKDYNTLLYGSENRKSSLDYLYNYTQAIAALNDEISDTKEVLNKATSINEATEALQSYIDATHKAIVMEKAQQEVLQAGIENYDKNIFSSMTYENKLTGEKITADLSKYVKENLDTGEIMIDLELLNNDKISDTWKDFLENNVQERNKLLKQRKDSIKNEKKLNDELLNYHKEAIKNYGAMEEEIADILKAQYEEEVENLKNKYDSMKEADDDYINALQEAIDKQRALREENQQYEELVEKEKKLALMQRDTSGGNQTEIKSLENEIKEDRQTILDSKIDDIINELNELYESQSDLRNTEIELKEALKDNVLYWNSRAESVATTFQTAEDYMVWMSEHSTEFANMTLAQQEAKLNEYGNTFSLASQLMAENVLNLASESGQYISDQLVISKTEIETTVENTGQSLINEAKRILEETKNNFTTAQEEAIKKINEAKTAYDNAATAAATAAEQTRKAIEELNKLNAVSSSSKSSPEEAPEKDPSLISKGVVQNDYKPTTSIEVKRPPEDSYEGVNKNIENPTKSEYKWTYGTNVYYTSDQAAADHFKALGRDVYFSEFTVTAGQYQHHNWRKYATGGLVNYTGPAWVDGSPTKPESFLSAEDTERIGNAARILANIPWLDRETDSSSVTTNNAGDVNVEINLNVDHISSDIDIDEMLERVKDEIVEVARPIGTNTILQQQL